MTKMDLAGAIYEAHGGLSRREALGIVEKIVGKVADSLVSGLKVTVSRFGKFHVAERRARKGRNPRTGEEFHIAPHRAPVFQPSKILLDRIND